MFHYGTQGSQINEEHEPKNREAAMIEEYLHEAFVNERRANARRDAQLSEALRELESRRAARWRDALHRVSQAIASVRLKRRTERMALR
jgi:hypothetical protein